MFKQKKGQYAIAAMISLCGVLFVIGYMFLGNSENLSSQIEDKPFHPTIAAENIPLADEAKSEIKDTKELDRTMGSYFIVVENEKIVIYFIDEFGAKQFIKQTEIPYRLLSETDQQFFLQGIELESLVEVYEMLQDFES